MLNVTDRGFKKILGFKIFIRSFKLENYHFDVTFFHDVLKSRSNFTIMC